MSNDSKRIGFVSLGCSKALVDSEQIITQLRAEGYGVDADIGSADLVVINTCGFIEQAIEESMDAIDDALHENGRVIVTGCLGANADRIRDQFPNVMAVTGPHDKQAVMQAVHEALPPAHDPYLDLVPPQGIKLTPAHYAYLKISEGCNHRCSFCIIPSLRGDLVSRPVNEVLQEAENLVQSGVKELLVISQDTSAYGVDVKYKTEFWKQQPVKTRMTELVTALGQMGVWVRLHYVYPYPHVDEIIPLMADGLVMPYLDIPFQHANPRILKLMKRPANAENVLKRLEHWRSIVPDIKIRSTFIVGFPGETDQEFEELLDFLVEARLDRVGCFTYSDVEGAAANELPGAIPEEVKQERQLLFMETQAEISAQKLDAMIGRELEVLVDDIDDNYIYSRSYGEAPEVDGMIVIDKPATENKSVRVGELTKVKITSSEEHDLFADLV